jgi:hypothetical protein
VFERFALEANETRVHQRDNQRRLVGKAAVQRALADTRRVGELIHGDLLDAARLEQVPRGGQDVLSIGGGIGPLT